MTCLICDGPADVFASIGDYEERNCKICGHYRVSGTVVAQLEGGLQKFDVPLMQQVLRQEAALTPIPMITSYIAHLN